MESLSGDALEAAKEAAGGSYSEVGSSIMDSITEGMQKRQELATRKAEAIVNKYIDKVSSTGTVRKYEKQAENYEKKAKTARENAQKSGKKGGNKEEEKKYEAQEKRFEKLSKKYKKKAEKYKKKFGEIGSSLVSSLSDRQCAFLQYVQKFLTYGAAGTYDCDFHFIDRLDCLVVSVEVPSCGPRGIVRFVSRKIHRRPRYRFRPCGRHRSPRRSCIGASGSVVRKCLYGRCRTDRRCKHFSRTHPR